MPAPSTRNDPFKNFNFLVEIDGIAPAAFKSVSGLSAEVEVIEYRTGAGRAHLHSQAAPDASATRT